MINNTKFSKLDLALRGLNVNEKYTAYISIPFVKFVLATFRKDPQFLASLDTLISKGYGVQTIQKKLKAKGYDVPYRTLGRWIANIISICAVFPEIEDFPKLEVVF